MDGRIRGSGRGGGVLIPHVFHQFPESRFSFPQKYEKVKFLQKLINVRCRLILSIDILNLRVFLKASAKRNSFLYLSMKKEHDRKAFKESVICRPVRVRTVLTVFDRKFTGTASTASSSSVSSSCMTP